MITKFVLAIVVVDLLVRFLLIVVDRISKRRHERYISRLMNQLAQLERKRRDDEKWR